MPGVLGRVKFPAVSGSDLASDIELNVSDPMSFGGRKPTDFNISVVTGGVVTGGIYTVKMKTVGGTLETLKDDSGANMTITLSALRTVKVLNADVEKFVLSPTSAVTGVAPTVTITVAGF